MKRARGTIFKFSNCSFKTLVMPLGFGIDFKIEMGIVFKIEKWCWICKLLVIFIDYRCSNRKYLLLWSKTTRTRFKRFYNALMSCYCQSNKTAKIGFKCFYKPIASSLIFTNITGRSGLHFTNAQSIVILAACYFINNSL